MPVDSESRSDCRSPLGDEQLLALCGLPEDAAEEAAPTLAALRAAAHAAQEVTWAPCDAERLAQIAALVAGALGRLPGWAPDGYHALRREHQGGVREEDVRAVVVQLLGLAHTERPLEIVAFRVGVAISQAVALGYLGRFQYDAWRPGMSSGAGWCTLVRATPLAWAKAARYLRDPPALGATPAPQAGGREPQPQQVAPAPVSRPAPPLVNVGNWPEGALAFAQAFQTLPPGGDGRDAPPGSPEATLRPDASRSLADAHDDSLLSPVGLAAAFGVNADALRTRLNRWRRRHHEGWIENTERGPREPRYLYGLGAVRHIIRALQATSETTSQRPARRS